MLANFFDRVTRLSVRWRWITILLSILVLAAGGYAFGQLNQELVPPVSFPQTVVVAQWSDADSTDQFLTEITLPLEQNFSEIEGVVNVESNTTSNFVFIIVRNEFGMNQDKMRAEIENVAEATDLPEDVEPEVITFSFSDFPVSTVSISAPDLTLSELKALIEEDLEPQLEQLDGISEVGVVGGQELPEPSEDVAESAPEEMAEDADVVADASADADAVEAAADADADGRSRLSDVLIAGLTVYDVEVEYAEEITPEGARGLVYTGGLLAMQALNLLTPDNLRAGDPATLAYLPSNYTDNLDPSLVEELNVLAADFGGVGQYTIEESIAANEAGIDVLTGRSVDDGTVADFPTSAMAAETEDSADDTMADDASAEEDPAEGEENGAAQLDSSAMSAIDLPEEWVTAMAGQGLEVATTADLTPEMVGGIAQAAPQMLDMLTPEMLVVLSPDVLAALPQEFLASLDPAVQEAIIAANAPAMEAAEPVALPDSWIAGAAAQGMEIATTADLTPEFIGGIAQAAPQLLAELTPDMLLAMSPDVLAALPQEFFASLDPAVQEAIIAANTPTVEAREPVALPDSWVAGAAAQGMEIATTADLTPEFIGGVAQAAPQLLDELTPEMLLAMAPELLAALPAEYLANLDPAVQQALIEANTPAASAGLPLPDSWLAAAAEQGLPLTTVNDLSADLIRGVALFSIDALADLTPEMLLAMPVEALTGFPQSWFASLPAELQTAIAEQAAAAQTPVDDADAADTNDSAAPAAAAVPLPEEWIAMAESQGLEIATTADLSAPLVQGIAQFAPEALDTLTPEMLLAMSADVLNALPPAFLANLDEDVKAQITEASGIEIADAPPAEPEVDPTALSPIFATVGEQLDLTLETVDDITPDFVRTVGAIGEQGIQLLGLLSAENLRVLNPEGVALLPAEYLDTLDPELRTYLDGRAVSYGGAGQLLITEAEAAAALSADAPPLSDGWTQPGENGEESQFQTAADLITNPFAPGAAPLLNNIPGSPQVDDPRRWIGVLEIEHILFLTENEPTFAENLLPTIAELLPAESLLYLLDNFPDVYDEETAERLRGVASGDVEVFVPEASITRADGNPSLVLLVYKESEANTVRAFHASDEVIQEFTSKNNLDLTYAFEQATFIEESIRGVSQEGVLGAAFAVLIILIFLSGSINGKYRLSWRATLITGLSIPSSILFAFLLMWLLPETIGPWLTRVGDESTNVFLRQMAKLFPDNITLNIMTLSGLTVAIGRVVDDSIVVLENSYRYIQKGEDPFKAVYKGTREVAVAIFAATVTTMAVFLPLGFVGGVISEFFLPFGLTVTYALAASYIVSITVVPALTALLIRRENIPEEKENFLQRGYTPVLEWTLKNRAVTMTIATLIFVSSLFLLTRLPNSFIPSLGDPTINVRVELEAGTSILDTNEQMAEFEQILLARVDGLKTVLSEVGSGGGTEALFGASNVVQNLATLTISIEEGEDFGPLTNEVRDEAEAFFGVDNVLVDSQVQTGFGGFQLIVTGTDLMEIVEIASEVEAVMAALDADGDGTFDMNNVASNAEAAADGATIIRIDGNPAISFAADLQTADTIGVAEAAIVEISKVLPANMTVSEGFDSQQQSEGFTAMTSAIGVSIILVYLVMALTFRSFVHPFTILFSLPFALVGASVALFLTNSVLGISAMMGLLMLVGVVVTNGIVLLEMVQQLREEGKPTYEALVEAGRTRLRPILMTALTAILALIPLALSTKGGAIIAAELGTAVIGGLIVSTALTLIVIPVVYSAFDQGINAYLQWQYKRIGRRLGASGD